MLNRPLLNNKQVDVPTIIKAIDDETDRIYEREKITSKTANTLDILGFAKVFIKSLYEQNKELKDKITKLESEAEQ